MKKHGKPKLLDPLPWCKACKGTGFVSAPAAPGRTGADGRPIKYDAPLMHCACKTAEGREFAPDTPPELPLDAARRAAGEREGA